MLQHVVRNALARGQNGVEDLKDLYEKIAVALAIGITLIVIVMWLMNITGMKEVNFFFLLGGVAVAAVWAFSPARLLLAVSGGALVQGLKDEDITQGAVKGIAVWYQVTLGAMLWFAIIAGILSVVPFQAKPSAFFPIAAMLLLMTLAFASVKNKALKWVIGSFAIAVIGYQVWFLVPEDWKPSTKPAVGAQRAPQAIEVKEPEWYGKKHSLTVAKGEITKPFEVEGGRCVKAWGMNPDGKAYLQEVRDVNEPGWHTSAAYIKKYPDRGIGWFRFTGLEEGASVTYAFYRKGECR